MPTFDEVYEIATSLGGTPVAIDNARCVVVRHRRASCRRCVGVCPTEAISIQLNEVKIDYGTCVGCGACVGVCPTEAIVALDPPEEALLAVIDDQARRETVAAAPARGDADETASETPERERVELVFTCARKEATREGDPDRMIVVPCLARLGERELMHAAARASKITLVEGGCESCRYRTCDEAIAMAVRLAEAMLAQTTAPTTIERACAFPDAARDVGGKSRQAARRGFFSDTKSLALEAASKALNLMIEERLPELAGKRSKPTMLEKLGMAKYGKLPRFEAARNIAVADDLEALGVDETATIDGRLFGSVDLRATECNGCGMCVTFCPTYGLQWGIDEEESDGETLKLRPVDFSAIDCVGCGLCVDVCPVHCIELSSETRVDELFDLEPETFSIPPAPAYSGGLKGW